METSVVGVGVALIMLLLGQGLWGVVWLLAVPFISGDDLELYGAVFVFVFLVSRFLVGVGTTGRVGGRAE